MLASRLSRVALAAALPALASAQSATLSSVPAATLGDLSTAAPLLEPMPFGPHSALERGVLVGGWIDPSYAAVGSLAAGLFDDQGALEYDLLAQLTEFIASGAGQRFGGVQGKLYQQGVATAIQVGGSWTIDTATNRGSFQLDLYLGGVSPTAPLLAVGSVKGRLSAPQGLGTAGGGQVLSSGQASATAPGSAAGSGPGEVSAEGSGALSQHGGELWTGAGSTGGICLAGDVQALRAGRRSLDPSAYPGTPNGGGSHGGPVCTGGPGMSAAGASSSGAYEAGATAASGSGSGGTGSSGAAAGSVGSKQLVTREAAGRWGLL